MAMKILKDHLPWMIPTAAVAVFATTGFFDRGTLTPNEPARVQAQPSVVQPTAIAAAPLVAQASQAALLQDQVVTRADTSIATDLTPTYTTQTTQNQPTFTDDQSNALVAAQVRPVAQPVQQPTTQVASFDQNPAAFFKNAQASLSAANSCKEDLRALTERAHVYFPSGGLTAEDVGLEQARLIGKVMQGCKGVGILVSGHSDPSGSPAINLRLSQQRAEFVIQRISAAGIDTTSFVPQGFGDSRPSNVTGPLTRAYYDRRVDFAVVDLQTNASYNTGSIRTSSYVPNCVAQLQEAVNSTKLFYRARSIAIPNAEFDSVLTLAQQAAACPQARLRIVGQHTDEAWADETVHTGILRAKALMSTLVGEGIASDQIIIAAPSRSVSVEGQPELSNSRVDFDVIYEPI